MISLIEGDFGSVMKYCGKHMKDKPFVFEFRYAAMDSGFCELNRFLWESRHSGNTHFKNRYEGNVLINVTAWNNNGINEYFEAFLYYLKDHEKQIRCSLFSETGFTDRLAECVGNIFLETKRVVAGEIGHRKEKAVIGFSHETGSSVVRTAAKAPEDM